MKKRVELYIKGLSESAKREIEQAEIQIVISKRESGWSNNDGKNLIFVVDEAKDESLPRRGIINSLFAVRHNLEERQKYGRKNRFKRVVVPAMFKRRQKKKRSVSNGRTKNSERI